ncbi:MAG: hypothetical protein J6S27_06095, partial [Thermoguttaceae bacterium]|nr:hypothetical protein [Thermoguttaceae bacterium]
FLICSLLLLFSPFQCAVLVPWSFFVVATENGMSPNTAKTGMRKWVLKVINRLFNTENIVAFFIMFVIAAFLKSNATAGKPHLITDYSLPSMLCRWGCWLVPYLLFTTKELVSNKKLMFMLCLTILCSFVQNSQSFDFSLRVVYPLSFFLMIFILEYLTNAQSPKFGKIWLSIVLCCSALYPIQSIASSMYREIRCQSPVRANMYETIHILENRWPGYFGTTDSFYYRYLAPHRNNGEK